IDFKQHLLHSVETGETIDLKIDDTEESLNFPNAAKVTTITSAEIPWLRRPSTKQKIRWTFVLSIAAAVAGVLLWFGGFVGHEGGRDARARTVAVPVAVATPAAVVPTAVPPAPIPAALSETVTI